MKRNTKVKGFTLIELIIVVAVFSVIMGASLMLMNPLERMMTNANVREQGSSNVSQISNYLEQQLGVAEYISTANFVPTDSERESFVTQYVKKYYSGILKNGATETAAAYGKGKVHVLVINNEANAFGKTGAISEYVYNVSFDPADPDVTLNTVETHDHYAVNKVIYDEYSYSIQPGITKYGVDADYHFSDFMSSPNDVKNTSFTINATTVRNAGKANEETYTFTSTATVPLVNIGGRTRQNGRPTGTYYVRNLIKDAANKNPGDEGYVDTYAITDISKLTERQIGAVTACATDTNESYGNRSTESYPFKGMCFVYSFGSEMLTD